MIIRWWLSLHWMSQYPNPMTLMHRHWHSQSQKMSDTKILCLHLTEITLQMHKYLHEGTSRIHSRSKSAFDLFQTSVGDQARKYLLKILSYWLVQNQKLFFGLRSLLLCESTNCGCTFCVPQFMVGHNKASMSSCCNYWLRSVPQILATMLICAKRRPAWKLLEKEGTDCTTTAHEIHVPKSKTEKGIMQRIHKTLCTNVYIWFIS